MIRKSFLVRRHVLQLTTNNRIDMLTSESSIGVKCEVDLGDQVWRSVCVGSLKMQEQHGVSEVDSLPQETNDLGTVVFVSIDGELTASILLQV